MKLILNSKSLLEKLQYLSGILSSNSTIPILDNFLFETENGELKITGSDLDNTMITHTSFEASPELEKNVCIAVPGKLLIEILKTLPHQPLTFHILENNTIEIISASGNYSIAYEFGEQFPKTKQLSDTTHFTINSKVLAKAISKTIFATGTDDLRPVMTGVLFQISESGANFVATDAHKLVKYSRKEVTTDFPIDFVMPKKPLNALKNILSSIDADVVLEFNESNVKIKFEEFELISRLIDAKYPAYEKVIPTENPNKIIIERSSFLSSLKSVALFSNKTTHQICLDVTDGTLKISAEDIDYSNKADERLNCSYEGEPMKIGFNSRFLIEMLSNLQCETIQLEMSMPNRAGILSPIDGLEDSEEILMLVMPVQLNN